MAEDEEEDQAPPPEEDDDESGESAEQRREQAAQTIGKTSSEQADQPAAATVGKSPSPQADEPAAATVGKSSGIAPIGSTEDLENKAAARTIPRTAAPETGSTEDLEAKADTNNPLMRAGLHPTTSGVASLWTKADNIHNPVLRVLGKIGAGAARAADTVGSIVMPGAAAMIPGSTLNGRMNENRQRAQETGDIENENKQAQTAHLKQETSDLQNPVPGDKTPEQDAYKQLEGQTNPKTGQPYTPLERYEAVAQAGQKPAPVNEADKPLENATQLNQALSRRFQVLHPGEQLPAEYTLPPGAKNGDYARIDASLKNEEGALGTKEAHDSAAADRTEARADRQSRQAQQETEKHQKDRDAFVQPLQGAIDNADYQKQYADGKTHTGVGDYQMMLQFQEAIVAGQKSGIRFNTAEQARIEHAQDLANNLRAKWGHLTGGTYFSDDQRHEIADAMEHVGLMHKQAIDRWDRAHSGAQQPAAAPPPENGGESKDFFSQFGGKARQ